MEYWKSSDPNSLKRLGDRLMAESLPHNPGSQPREVTANQAFEAFKSLDVEPESLAETLGVTLELLGAWLDDRVRAPESLPLVLNRLAELTPTSKD